MEVFKAPEYEVFERQKASIKAESLNYGKLFHLSGLFLGRINSPNPPLKKGCSDFFGLFCPILRVRMVFGFVPQVILLQTKSLRQRRNRTRQNLKEGGSTMRKSRITQDRPFQ